MKTKLTDLQALYEKVEEAHDLAMSMRLYLLGEQLSAIMDQLYEMSLKELPF